MNAPKRPSRSLLFFSRSVLFEHPAIARQGSGLSFAENEFVKLAGRLVCTVDCTKDGTAFEQDLDRYAAIVTYSCGRPADLMQQESKDQSLPLTERGLANLGSAVRAGKPLVGVHPGLWLLPEAFGADCIGHGSQQVARMLITSPKFPGTEGLADSFSLLEEWFSLVSFASDLHVVLVQHCAGMNTDQPADRQCYARPPFPATWARMHGRGRVFYTSMGHREDVWTAGVFQQILLGGLAWALGEVVADVAPNLDRVAPQAGAIDP
jgi:type 1 glutamine amidotransferase